MAEQLADTRMAEGLDDRVVRLVNKAAAVFPKSQRGELIVKTVNLLYSTDPGGFPERLAEKVMSLPGKRRVGVEIIQISLEEAKEILDKDVVAGLGPAGLSLAFIVAELETLDLLFPNLAG